MPNYPNGQPRPAVANVTTADIDFQNASNDGKFIDFEDTAAVWDEYHILHRYERDEHIYMLGTTSEELSDPYSDPVGFVRLARPTMLWIVEWKVERMKSKPKIPDYNVGPQWVLLDAIPQTDEINVGPDGVSLRYQISGTYIYGKKRPNRYFTDDMSFPLVPYVDGVSTQERTVDLSMMQQGIITPGGAGITGGGELGISGPFPVS
jgi:hypothetical protein